MRSIDFNSYGISPRMSMNIGSEAAERLCQNDVCTAVQKTYWLRISLNRHGCNGPLRTELKKLYTHSISKSPKTALFHNF
jgi:hypothetical protein